MAALGQAGSIDTIIRAADWTLHRHSSQLSQQPEQTQSRYQHQLLSSPSVDHHQGLPEHTHQELCEGAQELAHYASRFSYTHSLPHDAGHNACASAPTQHAAETAVPNHTASPEADPASAYGAAAAAEPEVGRADAAPQ